MESLSENSQAPELRRFFGSGKALQAVRACLADCRVARIATAFFEPSGWGLLDDTLEDKQVRLLIGREEGAQDKIGDLLNEFLTDVENGQLRNNPELLRKVMKALRAGKLAIRLSENKIKTSLEARYLYHHAKLYIADECQVLVTSANFTRHGLQQSREAGFLVTNPEDTAYFVQQFDLYFEKAESVTEYFIEALEQLLDLRSPREVYARTLLEIYGIPDEALSRELPAPMDYQRPVISRLLHSITEYGGAFLVASTGLGKTVIAAHTVAILRNRNTISSVLVVAPAGLRDMWMQAMRAARISSQEYSYQILSLDDWRKFRAVMHLDNELKQNLRDTLLILDESHHMRNAEDTANELRLRNARISKATRNGARILLLTATPYSRSIEDINNQLALLPQHEKKGDFFTADVDWKITRVRDLSDQPPVTILTAPTVIRYFTRTDETGKKYVEYSDERRMYFPHVLHLRSIEFQNPHNENLRILRKSGLLEKRPEKEKKYDKDLFDQPDTTGKRDALFEARLMHQFCSSDAMVTQVLRKLEKQDGYDKMRFARQSELSRTAKQMLADMTKQPELKFDILCKTIRQHPHEKFVIFCIYRETARSLTEQLGKTFPEFVVSTTVDAEPDQLETILDLFAPIANGKIIPGNEDEFQQKIQSEKIDILVASEAMAEGFNLQDARILINYDLPWSVLQLAQRMGRLMRPWHEPREIYIYNFLPDTMFDKDLRHGEAWRQRLQKRNAEQKSFANLPVIPEESNNEAVSLEALSGHLQEFKSEDLSLAEVMNFIGSATQLTTSGFLDDLAQMTQNELKLVQSLRPGFRSRVTGREREPCLFLLVAVRRSVFPAVFNEQGGIIMPPYEISKALQLLRDHQHETIQESDLDIHQTIKFEELCLNELLKTLNTNREQARIICSLHFVPQEGRGAVLTTR